MAEDFPSGLADSGSPVSGSPVAGSPVPGNTGQIASYEMVEELGRGGMAVVYRARDVRLGRWVALKVLGEDLARDEAFRRRFIRESRAAAAVDHPNIIPIFDAGEANGAPARRTTANWEAIPSPIRIVRPAARGGTGGSR